MFLDQELKNIQDAKNRLGICCDLRRHLVVVEVRGFHGGVRRTLANLTMGLAVVEQVLGFLRERKGSRK